MLIQPVQTNRHTGNQEKQGNTAELKLIDPVIKGAQIAGIGEGAHFVMEFNELRKYLIQYLIEEHGFNAIALECSRLQANRLTMWLNDNDDDNKPAIKSLERYAGPLTCALYGSVLAWLKQYLNEKAADIELIGADLPNTLSPVNELMALSSAVQEIDPATVPETLELEQILTPITGESAVMSASAWDSLSGASRDRAFSILTRLRLRFSALAPVISAGPGEARIHEVLQIINEIEYTLESLRTMSNLFAGKAIEGETSVRDAFIADSLENLIHSEPGRKVIFLAHNNHIQKTPIYFADELSGVPAGHHLHKNLGDHYRSIAFTHLGAEVPEMDFPAPQSPTGFSVMPLPADEIQKNSIEHQFLQTGFDDGVGSLLTRFTDDDQPMADVQRMRSQSASVVTDVRKAFDAVFCVKQATQDGNVKL
jgi:erythromycin esterase